MEAILAQKIKPGDIVVIRYEGVDQLFDEARLLPSEERSMLALALLDLSHMGCGGVRRVGSVAGITIKTGATSAYIHWPRGQCATW